MIGTDHGGPTRVLVVGDGEESKRVRSYLEETLEGVTAVAESDVPAILDRVRQGSIECIVDEVDPSKGLDRTLLDAVREVDSGLPFLVNVDTEAGEATGSAEAGETTGSAEAGEAGEAGEVGEARGAAKATEVATEAIEAGATDYVSTGEDANLDILRNRVENAITRYRAEQDGRDHSADRQLQETNEKVTALHDFAVEMGDCDEIAEVFDRTVDAAEQVLEFDRCTADRRSGDELVPAARSSNVAPTEVRTFEIGEGVAGRTLVEEKTFVIEETQDVENAEPVSDGIRSAISVPIGQYGVFQATSSDPNDFDETDVEFAELVASHAREAIVRIENEQRLRMERDRLAALFENIPQPAARVRIGDREDGSPPPDALRIDDQDLTAIEVDAANEAYEETFGLTAEEHDADQFQEMRIPDDGKAVNIEKAAEHDEPIQTEVRRQTNDGINEFRLTIIPVEGFDAQLLYAVYADMEEQKRTERTLRNLHEATREMLRVTDPDEVAEITTRTAIDTLEFPTSAVRLYDEETHSLEPTYISEEATALLGERPAYGPGDDPMWKAYEDGEPVVINDLDVVETTLEFPGLRSLFVMPVGEHGVMPIGAAEPNYFDSSDVQLVRVLASNVEVALDRAERVRQLRERDERLEREVDRLEKFASVVSHDLRNPLSVAAGHLDFARSACENPEAETHFDRVAEAHDRMDQLVEDVLSLAREGQTVDEPEPVSLSAVTERGWRTVETQDATLRIEDDRTVDADPERLWTLLENLFRNAADHGGSDVTVTVGSVENGFFVADDGDGMDIEPEEALSYGVSDTENGTGFGLAIVREIADAHGWDLTVETPESGGTRFVFEW